jgi:hypothetical protein
MGMRSMALQEKAKARRMKKDTADVFDVKKCFMGLIKYSNSVVSGKNLNKCTCQVFYHVCPLNPP